MNVMLEGDQKLNFGAKLTRLGMRLRDPDWRKHFRAVLAGKAIGLALLMAVIVGIAVIPALLSASQGPCPGIGGSNHDPRNHNCCGHTRSNRS